MKLLKRLFLLIMLLVLVAVGVAYLLPAQVHVERSTVIATPPAQIFAKVNNLKEWPEWSPWYEMDTGATYEYSGAESGVGAKVAWSGEAVGKGTQEITRSEPNERIEAKLDFMEQGRATSDWTFEETGHGTKVTWGFDTDMGMNPISRYMGLMMDSMIGKDYDKGLAKLKRVCEAELQGDGGKAGPFKSGEDPLEDQRPAEDTAETKP